jgi:nicotinamide-nucleotide amidase
VDRIIGDLIRPGQNPEVGLLASVGEIKIRIAAHAANQQAADRLIQPVEQEIRSRLGRKIYGRDKDTLEGVIDAYLTEAGFDLAILETFSAGLAAQRLYCLPCRNILESRVMTDRERLVEWLGIRNQDWKAKEALQIAERFRELSQTGMALVILGFPATGSDEKPFQGLAVASGREIARDFTWEMGGDMHTLQLRGAVIGLNTLRLTLMEHLFSRSS